MYIRRGGSSEAVASVLHSVATSVPEMLVTGGTMFRIGAVASSALSLKSSLGGGLLVFLGIPAIVVARFSPSLPLTPSIREFGSYIGYLILLLGILLFCSISIFSSISLLAYFAIYAVVVSRTYRYEQRQRDMRRETRLLKYLAPIQAQLAEVELAALDEVYPGDTSRSPQPPSLTTQSLSYVCIKAHPGTESEQQYIPAILNSILLELVLSYLVSCIFERWFGFLKSFAFPMDILGWVVIPLLVQSYNIYLVCSSKDGMEVATILSSLWQSHCVSSSLGIGLPWFVWTVSRGPFGIHYGNLSLCVFVVAGFVTLTFIYAVGHRSQDKLIIRQGSRFYISAFLASVALLGFINSVSSFI